MPDQLIDSDIKRAVDEQLAGKGLTKVETNADLYVGYHAVIHEEKGIDLSALGKRPVGRMGRWPVRRMGKWHSDGPDFYHPRRDAFGGPV